MHIAYPKIKHLNNEECEGILEGDVYIQEKLDGCFTSGTYIDTEFGVKTIGEMAKR